MTPSPFPTTSSLFTANNNNNNNNITNTIMNTSITLPLLSALPPSTTHTLTKQVLKQCWAESTIRDFLKLIIERKRLKKRRDRDEKKRGNLNGENIGGDSGDNNDRGIEVPSKNENGNVHGDSGDKTTSLPCNMSTSKITNTASATAATAATTRSGHTAKTHFLFRNLHSNNLTIRQSCILTLIQAVEEDCNDYHDSSCLHISSDSVNSDSEEEQEEEIGRGKNRIQIHSSTKELKNDEAKHHHQYQQKAVSQSSSSTTPTTKSTPSKIIKWNYKLILRSVIWDLIQDDFASFLHSSFFNIGGSGGNSSIDFDSECHDNYASSSSSFMDFDSFGTGTGTGTSATENTTSTTNTTGKKSIVQLVALFMYLLEHCEDDDNLQYSQYYFKKDCWSGSTASESARNNNSKSESAKDDYNKMKTNPPTKTKTATATATATPSKIDHDMKQNQEERHNCDGDDDSDKYDDHQKLPQSFSSSENSNNDNPNKNKDIDYDGRSAMYHFIIKGGLKWISEMIQYLVQLLLALNNINHLPSSSYSNPTLSTSSMSYNDRDSRNINPNQQSDKEELNPLFAFQFTSPSTLNKPRHYFHSLKQSSNAILLFNPMLEQEILMRLSLLVDMFMRISLVGYLYPPHQHHKQQQKQKQHHSRNSVGEEGQIGINDCENDESTSKKGKNKSKATKSPNQSQQLPQKQHQSRESSDDNNHSTANKQDDNNSDGDDEMANVDDNDDENFEQQHIQNTGEEDGTSTILNALKSESSATAAATASDVTANKKNGSRNLASSICTPISIIDNDKSYKNTSSSSTRLRTSHLKITRKSEKERQNRRIQVLQTIRHYIWRQSDIGGGIGALDTTTLKKSSKNESSLFGHPSEFCHLSPLASLMTASFVLSTTTPPPTPIPSSSSSSGTSRSIHSLSFLTSTLMSGMIPNGSRLRNSSEGSNTTNSNSAEKISFFSDDYPILPGSIRTERVISYLNKLTDPNQDVTVILKSKDVEPSIESSNRGAAKNDNSSSERRKKLMALKNRKRKIRNDSAGNNSGLPMGLESVLVRAGKRRRLTPADAMRTLGLSSGGGAANLSEQSEMQREEEEEMSSSTARAILRAVVVGDRAAERGTLVRETSNPFGFSVERSSHDSVTELMARDMMETLLERRRNNHNISNRIEGRTSSSIRSSLDESGFMHVDTLDRPNGDNENKNYEDGEVRDGNSNDEHEANDNNENEDIEVDDDDEECVEDGDANGMEIVEAEDGDEEIDSDLEEQNKPMFGVQDEDDEDAMVDNIVVEDGSPFEILDEDDIMLGFDQVRGLHSSDQIIASVMDTSTSLGTRGRNDSNASGASGGTPSPTATINKSHEWRKSAYIQAGMEILTKQHNGTKNFISKNTPQNSGQRPNTLRSPILTPSAEQSLVQSICKIVKPPKKPLKLKIFMRRAPTQEEFFRGNISRNPLLISSIKIVQDTSSNSSADRLESKEPRVRDLRQHIANDLQMGDSAELLELLVANKILDMDLKLRVVSQTLWRTHVTENAMVTHSEPASLRQLMSSGFNSGTRLRVDENTPISSLPPMVVTYRLAGVDGEATEDKVEVGDLVDPEAPPDTKASAIEYEKQMEKEFGLTRLATRGRGVFVLLRSIETYLTQIMKNIRRDDVGRRQQHCLKVGTKNLSRERFLKGPPCASLTLLRHCSKLADNRRKLVDAKAPTVLLRLMLEVLNSVDEFSSAYSGIAIQKSVNHDERPKKLHRIVSNPTTELLQELIETLASEISTTEKSSNEEFYESDSNEVEDYDKSTLPMVLSSLTTTSLSPPLRKVIAKLLPFLTYGQVSQSKALAQHFISHIDFACLGQTEEVREDNLNSKIVLMETFVDAAIHLPPVSVCDTLRSELIQQGFVSNIKKFLLKEIPETPPPWSAALFPKVYNEVEEDEENKQAKRDLWRIYYDRIGLQTGFDILIGLCKEHIETQSHVANDSTESTFVPFLTACHWLESTSDKSCFNISTKGLGILAETLLDTLSENNEECEKLVKRLRKQTRDRKKEMAQERRSKALVDMSAFGRLVGAGAIDVNNNIASKNKSNATSVGGVFTALSHVFSSRSNQPKDSVAIERDTKKDNSSDKVNSSESKPSWMLEMEAMEDESGLTCAVCQEGRTLQPTEMLGLYTFMKKVAIPSNKGGLKGSIDGALLLLSLPYSLPVSLRGTEVDKEWFKPAKAAASSLKSTQHGAQTLSAASSSILSSRTSFFITTVTAGNAIHLACHAKARTADRNHPKAPKSEWEGASLRNSRVSCNAILPLVSQKNSKVPVMSLESALADQQVAISNLLGTQPKSMLWTILHDVRLLLLRIAHGESLSTDCGGGSLTSNCTLIYYLLFLADLFARDAEVDSPATVQHAKQLTPGFLAVSSILRTSEFKDENMISHRMCRSFADAAPMAAICCMLFSNKNSEESSCSMDTSDGTKLNEIKTWDLHKDHFLRALIRCAGRRFALGIDSSGCESNRGSASGRSTRSSSFSEWDSGSVIRSSTPNANLQDYATALQPMLTFYAVLDQISKDFVLGMEDEKVEESAERIVYVVGQCQKADDMKSLLSATGVTLDDNKIMDEIIAGIHTANPK